MDRTFGIQTLTGNPQPLLSDVTTAAIVPGPPGGLTAVKVADNTKYLQGDRIEINPENIAALTTDIKFNILMVDKIDVDGLTLWCKSEGDAPIGTYPTATLICLSLACMDITVQAVYGAVNLVYIGTKKTITNAGVGPVVFEVTPNLPFRKGYSTSHNTLRSTDYWMAATLGTQVIVSVTQL